MPGPYTRSKFLAERAAQEAAARGMPVVIVNPTVPIGPGDRNMTAPTAMLSLFTRHPPRLVLDCILNLVDVRDLADGIALAGERGRSGARYLLGGENVRLRELTRRIGAITGQRMAPLPIPGLVALIAGWTAERLSRSVTHRPPVATAEAVRIATRSVALDSRKAAEELGYAPRAIDRALADALAWLAARAAAPPALQPAELRRATVRHHVAQRKPLEPDRALKQRDSA
jgi:dihydroflavonol-4-reductase